MSSTLKRSPFFTKRSTASARLTTRRAKGALRAMISRIFASMAGKSSGVKGSLRWKS